MDPYSTHLTSPAHYKEKEDYKSVVWILGDLVFDLSRLIHEAVLS